MQENLAWAASKHFQSLKKRSCDYAVWKFFFIFLLLYCIESAVWVEVEVELQLQLQFIRSLFDAHHLLFSNKDNSGM